MGTEANIVVIGAGIIGASVAYHLAQMGIDNVVVVDKGELDVTDGSTSHAPGGLRTLTASHFFTTLGVASRAVYDKLPLAVPGEEQFWRHGSVQVANTPERFDTHKRLAEMGLSEGVEANLLTPNEIADLVPLIDPNTVHGGIHIPSSGVVDTMRLANSMRNVAEATGRARFVGNSEVVDIEETDGRLTAVVTTGELGRITCNQAIVCTNIWAPLLAEKTGFKMPLYPGEHQYIYTTPIDSLDTSSHVSFPVVAMDDISLYFRQHGDHLGIGSYDHPAKLVNPAALPRTAKMPFTADDFDSAWEKMQHHMPTLHNASISDGFNGMFSFSVDGMPVCGETAVKGLWTSVGAWLSFASELGRVMAQWMTTGDPGMDMSQAHINRFFGHQTNDKFLSRQAKYFYEIGFDDIHPTDVVSSVRHVRHSPCHARLEALGAQFIPVAGQEAPLYYEANAPLVDRYRDQIPNRAGYDAQGWSPIMGAEHLEMRANVGIVDWTAAIAPIEVSGPRALEHLQYLCTADIDLPVGGITYSLILTQAGMVARDVTVSRMGDDTWWILTGKGNLAAEFAYYQSLAPLGAIESGAIRYSDLGEAIVPIAIWGPNSRAVLQACSGDDVSNETFPWYTWQNIDVGMASAKVLRISYVGELGYEIYVPTSYALHVWDTLWEAGRQFDMPAVGAASVFSGRMEKGYRLWGGDTTPEFSPKESGLSWAMDTSKEFHGKDAALAAPVRRRIVTLQFIDRGSVVYGWEPVTVSDGACGDTAIGYIAGAGDGFNVGSFIAHAFLDKDRIESGLEVEVHATGVRHRAVIAKGPLFDRANERLKS
jgi:glycine cleavage system aminomethyltransferase T/glycine/D-amino acid oxidase-like deaminating enzyme